MKLEKINDFGFTTEADFTIAPDNRMQKIEELVLPLIQNLIDSGDKDIVWKNRKEPLEKLKKQILEITRA